MSAAGEEPFGTLLRKRRREAGFTQEELAERAGTSARTISDIERGISSSPYRATIEALADALGLDEDERLKFHAAGARRRGPVPETHGTGIPHEPNPLLGRERDVAALLHMLRFEGARLVTITGQGGVGKTRLAAHLVDRMRRHIPTVWFVTLDAVEDVTRVPTRVAREIGLELEGTVDVEEALAQALQHEEALLVLDNLEQVLAVGPLLARLLQRARFLHLLLTSREPLRLRAEREYPLTPLDVPDPMAFPLPQRVADYAAVALFVDRARAVRPHFRLTDGNARVVAEICARLDGLPLAIELAAAWVRTLSPQSLVLRLERPLDVLAGGPADLPSRQQTMRATIAWSYSLLSPSVAELFRRLAPFAGGLDLHAAQKVCAGPCGDVLAGLHELVTKNLVVVVPEFDGGEERWALLRTIRGFAEEALAASGESEAARRAHRDFYLRLAQEADAGLFGPDQDVAIRTLDRELDNLRTAFEWSLEEPGEAIAALQLATDLGIFFQLRGYVEMGSSWFARALEAVGSVDDERLATALNMAANIENMRGEYAAAAALYGRALEHFQRLGLQGRVGTVLGNLAVMAEWQERTEEAERLYSDSLAAFRAVGDAEGVARTLVNSASVVVARGRLEAAEATLREALAYYRSQGDHRNIGGCLSMLGYVAGRRGDRAEATALHRDALRRFHESGALAEVAGGLELLVQSVDDDRIAVRLLAFAHELRGELGRPVPPSERGGIEDTLSAARARVGQEGFERLWQEGVALSTEAAIGLALRPDSVERAPGVQARL